MTNPSIPQNLSAIMEQVENISPETASLVFHSFFSFRSDIQLDETVKKLLDETRKSPENQQIVLHRLLALLKEIDDHLQYADPYGIAMASYLYVLYRTQPDLAHQAIREMESAKKHWWSMGMVNQIKNTEYNKALRDRLKDKTQIVALLRESGLKDNVEGILSYATPCIRLHTFPSDNPVALPPGASHIGGLPDLPQNLKWPIRHERLCEFVAQINLKDASAYDSTGLLPQEGLLLFFFDNRDYEDVEAGAKYPFEPYQKGSETILYYTGDLTLLERVVDFPDSLIDWQHHRTCSVEFAAEWMLPSFGSYSYFRMQREVFHCISYDDPKTPEIEAYNQMIQNLEPYMDENKHHLFGYPEPVIQDDPFYTVPWDKQKNENDAYAEWVLLLQISSNDGAEMLWGDTSSLYYYIQKDDLIARRFENAVCILQFH